jgi:hydroxymethylglutaryl-CoA reductase
MEIIATVGLAQNFAALKSLTTSGIQKGHMKMHLTNILAGFQATDEEMEKAKNYFGDKTISVSGVREYLEELRKK